MDFPRGHKRTDRDLHNLHHHSHQSHQSHHIRHTHLQNHHKAVVVVEDKGDIVVDNYNGKEAVVVEVEVVAVEVVEVVVEREES